MGGTDERKTSRKQRKGDKCIRGAGQVRSDRMERIKGWRTKSAELFKRGSEGRKKAWITTHKYALSDMAEVKEGRSSAH